MLAVFVGALCALASSAALTIPLAPAPHAKSASQHRRRHHRLPTAPSLAVSVSGNHLVDARGQTLMLVGLNRSGTQYMCVLGRGIFDGPASASSIATMKSWRINSVRVPINEDCWLGINEIDPQYSGAEYRAAVEEYVAALNAAGLYVILDVVGLMDVANTLAWMV